MARPIQKLTTDRLLLCGSQSVVYPLFSTAGL